MPAGVLTQHQTVRIKAHGPGLHNLVSHPVFKNTVLMNAGFMGKGIGSHDGLVGLHHNPCNHAHQSTGRVDLLCL